ncbi:MAG TPA: isoprenylcysteine carboxylmethyltransferase family protein [Ktedonobacterales bacterium]|jgi:protein-S-isoprenylcysteine O-methyltransferase Ste14
MPPAAITLAALTWAALAEQVRVAAGLAASAVALTGYWQSKVLAAVYVVGSLPIIAHLLTHPALLRRRMSAVIGERDPRQRLIVSLAVLCVGAQVIVATTDHRFGWSDVPVPVVLAGDVLVAAGLVLIWLVFRANQFAAATIQVEAEQKVIATGPYAVVRHPMYSAWLLLVLGIPLALASWWGLVAFPALVALIVWRLTEEERYLAAHLPGYGDYRTKVTRRLVPGVW